MSTMAIDIMATLDRVSNALRKAGIPEGKAGEPAQVAICMRPDVYVALVMETWRLWEIAEPEAPLPTVRTYRGHPVREEALVGEFILRREQF